MNLDFKYTKISYYSISVMKSSVKTCYLCMCLFFLLVLLYTLLPLGKVPAPISATVAAGAPTAARVLLKQRSEDPSIGRSSASTGLATGSPTSPSEDASVVGRGAGTAGGQAEDDHSDKGTYTIELENRNAEEEEARRMIDKVGVFRDVSNYLRHVGSFLSTSAITIICLGCIWSPRLDRDFLFFNVLLLRARFLL